MKKISPKLKLINAKLLRVLDTSSESKVRRMVKRYRGNFSKEHGQENKGNKEWKTDTR